MKTLRNIIIITPFFVLVLFNSCTRQTCESEGNKCDTCASFYPEKDTFRIGDTIWIKLIVPNLFYTECGSYSLNKDSISTGINLGYSKYKDSLGFVKHNVSEKNLIFEKGSLIIYNNNYFFEYDKSKDYYSNEFGIVLNDTGTIYIGSINGISIHISDFINNSYSIWRQRVGSSFINFKETQKGYFNIYVKP